MFRYLRVTVLVPSFFVAHLSPCGTTWMSLFVILNPSIV